MKIAQVTPRTVSSFLCGEFGPKDHIVGDDGEFIAGAMKPLSIHRQAVHVTLGPHIPKIFVLDTTVDTLCHGANLKVPGVSIVESYMQVDEKAAIMTLKEELVAIGTVKMISKDIMKKEKSKIHN